jgi:tetratricopeptide (TPR) repeat protein
MSVTHRLFRFGRHIIVGIVFFSFGIEITLAQKNSIQSLQKLLKSADSEHTRTTLLNELTEAWLKVSYDSALYFGKQALESAQKTKDKKSEALAGLLLGEIYYRLNSPQPLATEHLQKAVQTSMEIGEEELIATALNYTGKYHAHHGETSKALEYHQKALSYSRSLKDKRHLAETLFYLGNIYQVKGKYDKALEYYQQSLAIKESADPQNTIGNLNEIGNIYFHQGLYTKATQSYQEALKTAQEAKNTLGEGYALYYLGRVQFSLGNYHQALKYFFNSLKKHEEIGNQEAIGNNLIQIAEVNLAQKNDAEGIRYIEQAIQANEKVGNKYVTSTGLSILGDIKLRENKLGEALDYYQQSLKVIEETGQLAGVASVYRRIGLVYRAMQDLPNEQTYLWKSLKIYREIGQPEPEAQVLFEVAQAYQRQPEVLKAIGCATKSYDLAQMLGNKQIAGQAAALLAVLYQSQNKLEAAFKYQSLAIAYKDSLYNEDKLRQIAETQARFETEKKDKENTTLKKSNLRQNQVIRYQIAFIIVFGVALLGAVIFAVFFFRSRQSEKRAKVDLQQKNEEVSAQKEEIETQRNDLETKTRQIELVMLGLKEMNTDLNDSIKYAQRIQAAMLPILARLQVAFPEHFILYMPRDVVSGDFYWFAERQYKKVIAAVDCTGHGIPGAFMSLIGNDLLNEIVNIKTILEPDKILEELRKGINFVLRQEESKNRDGMDVAICVIDSFPTEYRDYLETPRLHYAGSHNPLIYFQHGEMHEVEGSKVYIGGYDPAPRKNNNFQVHSVDISEPTTFYIFSDGYQDQLGGDNKKRFAKKRMRSLIAENHHLPLPEQGKILEQTMRDWIAGSTQTDDILVIGVKIPEPSHWLHPAFSVVESEQTEVERVAGQVETVA